MQTLNQTTANSLPDKSLALDLENMVEVSADRALENEMTNTSIRKCELTPWLAT